MKSRLSSFQSFPAALCSSKLEESASCRRPQRPKAARSTASRIGRWAPKSCAYCAMRISSSRAKFWLGDVLEEALDGVLGRVLLTLLQRQLLEAELEVSDAFVHQAYFIKRYFNGHA